jgi:hypothetical protein
MVLGPQALFTGMCRIVRMVKDKKQSCKVFLTWMKGMGDRSNSKLEKATFGRDQHL